MPTHPKGDNVTKTFSLESDLLANAEERVRALKLPSFSFYVRKLIEDDLAARGSMSLSESHTSAPAPAAPTTATTYLKNARRKPKRKVA